MNEDASVPIASTSSVLCPSKSTVYLGNISYTLTNNDLFKIMEHCGKVVCVKIVKDKVTRRSKGYAFIQFLQPEAALKCVQEYDNVEMFGRKWNCSIANDNGRTSEFVRKRVYPDKTRCFECGEFGHLSYKCPKNALGNREPPPKKKRKKKTSSGFNSSQSGNNCSGSESSSEEEQIQEGDESVDEDSLSAAISYQRKVAEEEDYREAVAKGDYASFVSSSEHHRTKRKFVRDEYFSDEENVVDGNEN